MKKANDLFRMKKLIGRTIDALQLNLSSMKVLTEAASGNFIVTPLIAALAGADKVYVVCRDSNYGAKSEILLYLEETMSFCGISGDTICCIDQKEDVADEVNIVTNLGFVRPIGADFIQKMRYDSAIPLMFESWEFRESDIDIRACKECSIPVLGTKETHPALQIFHYVGMSALKLLLENNIEVFKSRILLISSGEYLNAVSDILVNNQAEVLIYNPYDRCHSSEDIKAFLTDCDAVVVAEQKSKDILIGDADSHINVKWLLHCKPVIIHIAGMMDYKLLDRNHILKMPPEQILHGYMTITTEYVGIRPVIELHAAGLKVGQALVEGMRSTRNADEAKKYALEHSPSMEFTL